MNKGAAEKMMDELMRIENIDILNENDIDDIVNNIKKALEQ